MSSQRQDKYNYIFYNMGGFLRTIYKDMEKLDNVCLCDGGLPAGGRFLNLLHKLHWSHKINRKVHLPLKKLWFGKMTKVKFPEERPVCHVFFGGQYCAQNEGLTEYIRKKNPENKVAIHYLDLIRKKKIRDFEAVRATADLIYTYDPEEAKQYGISYFAPCIYSPLVIATQPACFDYDLYFLGYAKDRLEQLLKICREVTDRGLCCCFRIAGVSVEQQIQMQGVEYLNTNVPYSEVVADIQKSKCILELTQEGAEGKTMRTVEAIAYKRKILTNRKVILNASYFSEKQFSLFDVNHIDMEFLEEPMDYSAFAKDVPMHPSLEIDFLEESL